MLYNYGQKYNGGCANILRGRVRLKGGRLHGIFVFIKRRCSHVLGAAFFFYQNYMYHDTLLEYIQQLH